MLLALAGLFSLAAPVSSAIADEFGIAPGGFTASMLDAEGHTESLAGSHPDRLQLGFALNLAGTTARDLEFELPAGLGGNPAAVPQCTREVIDKEEECPPESQVGTFEVVLLGGEKATLPLFEQEPLPGQFISFGSKPFVKLPLKSEIRPADFGITLKANELPKEPIAEGHFELWGIPADHQKGTGIPRRALLTAPATCGPLNFTFRARSWVEGAPWLSASTDTGTPLGGCASLSFAPKLGLQFSEPVADSPTGLRMELSMPEEEEGNAQGDARIKNVNVELPADVGVSPGGAEGLAVCTDAQLGLGSGADAQCSKAAEVGTAEFSSPALGGPLIGTIYLGEEHPGQRIRTFVVVPGPGTVIKFVSTLNTNPATGRLSTALENLPQVPIKSIGLIFAGGPRALLVSPLTCGSATGLAKFEPYGGGSAVESASSVSIGSRAAGGLCTGPGPFAPRLTTQNSVSRAGRPTTFSTTLQRRVGEQLPRKFSVTLPAGMSASLGSIKACSNAAATANACPPESRVGSVLAKVGSGLSTAALPGSVYLTDSYKRAPFGLLMEFHAAIGPFNLGTLAMRGVADLDGRSGRFTVSMDSLPAQVEGVPIRFQTIELDMDRPGFLRNPTSCSPRSTEAALESQIGTRAIATSPLGLYGCKQLGFKPRIEMGFLGRGEVHKGGNPGLLVTARLRKGDTSLRGMKLSLPPDLKFAAGSLKEICSRIDATQGTCPSDSRVGTARARSALLDKPLSGSVYIAQPADNGSPDIWVSLAAMGVRMSLEGETSAHDGRFVTALSGLPDLPLSEFTMRLGNGENHIFSFADSPCAKGRPRPLVSTVGTVGQNGARRTFHTRISGMKASCKGSPRPHAALPKRLAPGATGTE